MIRHHERMTIVLIDTNAVHRDPWMRNDPGTNLLAAAAAGECRIVFPQVVVDELRRQQSEWLKKHRKELAATIQDMRGNPVDVEGMAATLETNLDSMHSQIDVSFDALVASKGVVVAPVPADVTENLVARDLAVRRPFLEVGSESWSTGFRDAVIWETALVLLDEMPEDEKLIFVTKDQGFLADGLKSLHQDLLDDLDARAPHMTAWRSRRRRSPLVPPPGSTLTTRSASALLRTPSSSWRASRFRSTSSRAATTVCRISSSSGCRGWKTPKSRGSTS